MFRKKINSQNVILQGIFSQKSQFGRRNNKRVEISSWLEAHVERQLKTDSQKKMPTESEVPEFHSHSSEKSNYKIRGRMRENTFTGVEYIHRRKTFTGREYIHQRRLSSPEENTFTGGEYLHRRRIHLPEEE